MNGLEQLGWVVSISEFEMGLIQDLPVFSLAMRLYKMSIIPEPQFPHFYSESNDHDLMV